MEKVNPSKRNCYCNIWQTNPNFFKQRNIPYSYCGICDCGALGHLRHAPDGAYTADFCDDCYRKLRLLNVVRLGTVIIIFASITFRHWVILLVAIGLIIFTFIWRNIYFEKYQAKLKAQNSS